MIISKLTASYTNIEELDREIGSTDQYADKDERT